MTAWTRVYKDGTWPRVWSGKHPVLYDTRDKARKDPEHGRIVRVTVTFETHEAAR